jgi:hypothetical protein
MCEYGAGCTIETPRQARAVIHVKNLGHRSHLYTDGACRKGDHAQDRPICRVKGDHQATNFDGFGGRSDEWGAANAQVGFYGKYETPTYEVMRQLGAAEVRAYEPHILAQVAVRNEVALELR